MDNTQVDSQRLQHKTQVKFHFDSFPLYLRPTPETDKAFKEMLFSFLSHHFLDSVFFHLSFILTTISLPSDQQANTCSPVLCCCRPPFPVLEELSFKNISNQESFQQALSLLPAIKN